MATHLSSGKVNFGSLRDAARRELLECLDKSPGNKALVWDEQLTGPLGLIAEYALLKEHDVTRMFQLKGNELPSNNVKHVIFLTRPKLSLMELIAENVRHEEKHGGSKKEFHILFVPRKSLLCEKKLKDLGVYGTFTYIDEYCVELFPFDSDLLSMEMENAFKDCVIDKDMTSMYYVAKTLMTLQSLYGIIPNIYVKGHCGKTVLDTLQRMRRELAGNEPQITPQIDNLLLLDRSVDLLTPLVTQLTYEGLIDEIYGLNNTTVKLPPEKFAKPNQDIPSEQKFVLNSAEELYMELRDKNFNAVGFVLSKKAKLINAQFEERHEAKTVGEIKQFVTRLPHLQAVKNSVATHTSIAELIKEHFSTEEFFESWHVQQEFINGTDTDKINSYIEECISKQAPLAKVLRLICMQSVTNTGLPKKVLDYYRHEIIQSYGYHHLLTLHNLEIAGLLRLKSNAIFGNIRKILKLTVDDVNEQTPSDIAYVYSGYAPLSVRLAQHLHRPGWRAIQEILELLPGERKEFQQKIDEGLRKRRNSGSSTHSGTDEQKVTLVFFLGGVTYAEISALRFLSQLEDAPTEYIIATTKLINGTTFIESLMEKFPMSELFQRI